MADDVLKSFLVELGWKIDERGERKVAEAVASITRQAAALALALEAAALAAAAAVTKIADQFDKLYFTSQRTGTSVQNIKGLSYAFSQVGGSGSQAVAAIESFQRAVRTNPGVTAFIHSLGVATTANGKARDSVDVLVDSIDAIQKRHPYYTGAQMAGILGIDEAQYNILSRYGRELREFRAEYDRTARQIGLNNELAAANSNKFMTALRSLMAAAQAVAQKILSDLTPVMTGYLNAVRDWIAQNPNKVEAAITGILNLALALARAIGDLVVSLTPLAHGFTSIAESLTGEKGATAAFKALGWVLEALIIAKLLRIGTLLVGLGGLSLPTWLLAALGVAGAAQASTALGKGGLPAGVDPVTGNRGSDEVGGGLIRPGEEGGLRHWWRRTMPRWLGGRGSGGDIGNDAPGSRAPIGGATFRQKAPGIMRRLMDDFGLNKEEAAIVLGNLGHESAGFTAFNEGGGGPGRGWAQWTEPGRKARFFEYARRHNLDPRSDEANYGFLRWELRNTHRSAIGRLKAARTRDEKMYAFERAYENAGIPAYGSRHRYANEAERAYDRAPLASAPAPTMPAAPAVAAAPRPMPQINMSPGGFDVNRLSATPMGSTTTSSSTVVNSAPATNVTIQGVSDPQRAAEHVGRAIENANQMSLRNAQTAVR